MRSLLVGLLVACGGDDPIDPSSDTAETTTSSPTSPTAPTNPADSGAPVDTWDGFAAGFFADYCVACHDTSPKDWTLYEDVTPFAEAIRCGVATEEIEGCETGPGPGQFPAGSGPVPSDDERARLVAWIDAGMPE